MKRHVLLFYLLCGLYSCTAYTNETEITTNTGPGPLVLIPLIEGLYGTLAYITAEDPEFVGTMAIGFSAATLLSGYRTSWAWWGTFLISEALLIAYFEEFNRTNYNRKELFWINLATLNLATAGMLGVVSMLSHPHFSSTGLKVNPTLNGLTLRYSF